ncbi:MAG: glycerol-3-phosphate dehydrogenase/oxidase, partial [Phycisphaerae bacterium]
ILGGGITGAGVARDAAMRGLSVLLVDSDDFASGTSHLTSKLVHGGLRYLEHGHIRPVVEGIVERYRLLDRMAPNLVHPLKFVMPFEGHRFPKWAVTLCGLQLYGLPEWYRCGRLSDPMLGVKLQRDYPTMRAHPFAVTFWDAQTNDARLVMATLRTAEAEGATLANYTLVTAARLEGRTWTVRLRSKRHQQEWAVRARTIVNATGPWLPVAAELLGIEPMSLIWIKGSHILLRRFERFGEDAIVIRSIRDHRPLWIIPWYNRLIVGSTELRYTGDLRNVRPTVEEVDDLFESFVHFFPTAGITRSDIRCAYAGVRPITPQSTRSENSLSREHRIDVDPQRRLVTIMGGKLTTFRCMAEQAINEVDRLLDRPPPMAELRRRLRGALLWPGLTPAESKKLRLDLARVFNGREGQPDVTEHLVRHYGRDASLILKEVDRRPHLGEPLFPGLPYCLAELSYLCRTEKVYHLIDLVKRRTPLYFLVDNCGFESLPKVVEHIAPISGWDARRRTEELSGVAEELRADMRAYRRS